MDRRMWNRVLVGVVIGVIMLAIRMVVYAF